MRPVDKNHPNLKEEGQREKSHYLKTYSINEVVAFYKAGR